MDMDRTLAYFCGHITRAKCLPKLGVCWGSGIGYQYLDFTIYYDDLLQ